MASACRHHRLLVAAAILSVLGGPVARADPCTEARGAVRTFEAACDGIAAARRVSLISSGTDPETVLTAGLLADFAQHVCGAVVLPIESPFDGAPITLVAEDDRLRITGPGSAVHALKRYTDPHTRCAPLAEWLVTPLSALAPDGTRDGLTRALLARAIEAALLEDGPVRRFVALPPPVAPRRSPVPAPDPSRHDALRMRDQRLIRDALRARKGRLVGCHEDALHRGRGASHQRAVLQFSIDASGQVEDPSVEFDGSSSDPILRRCLTRVIAADAFPRALSETISVRYPLTLRASR